MALITFTIGTTSTLVAGVPTLTPARRKLTFHNPNIAGQQVIYGAQAPAAAVVGSGLAIMPGEKYDIIGDQALTGWNFIGSAAGANVSVIEYLHAAGNIPSMQQFTMPVG
jgi:hypothetical protein